jgi:hypothetical protein
MTGNSNGGEGRAPLAEAGPVAASAILERE